MYSDYTIKNIAHTIFIVISLGYLSYIGMSIILPFVYAMIFAIFLYPINKKVSRIVKSRIISIAISYLIVLVPIAVVGIFFVAQLLDIIDKLPSIGESLKKGSTEVMQLVERLIPGLNISSKKFLNDIVGTSIDGPLNVVGKGVMSSTSVIFSTFLVFIYSFLILFYRKSIKSFILFQFRKRFRPDIRDTLTKIKLVIQSYIGGLFLVIAILSTVNSLGLWIIGIDYPIFWGTLAGFLAVIPYIGTGLGGLMPFLYSLATTDTVWQPVAIIIFYSVVQTLEGNIITPKIVGDKVNINPLAAILSLVFFGSIWGIGGVILALPLISIARIIMMQFENTTPLAILMSSDLDNGEDKFMQIASERSNNNK